ncbi:MAG: hypothetical protein AB7N76_10505 [Planctomycetota bacterium]
MSSPLLRVALALLGLSSLALADDAPRLVRDGAAWSAGARRVAELERRLPAVSLRGVLADLNRKGQRLSRAGHAEQVQQAFAWEPGDGAVKYWYPQGITGSMDGLSAGHVGGRKVLLVGWYHKPEEDAAGSPDKGVRVSVVDATEPNDVRYRHVLLAEPVGEGAAVDLRPVRVHAGGIAWFGRYLFVCDTTHGFRVFDATRVLRVAGADKGRIGRDATGVTHAFGYRYVMLQVGRYQLAPGSEGLRFSFVGLDRSTSPPSLLSGEYHSGDRGGRLARWPLDAGGGLLAEDARGRVDASETLRPGHTRMQGAVSYAGRLYVSASSQDRVKWWGLNYGRLYVHAAGAARARGWIYGPEDLCVDPTERRLWSVAEHPGQRLVVAVRLP